MSLRALTWVLYESKSEGNARLVMLALADNADEEGACWPAIPTIAHKARVSERTVQRCLRELAESGELVVAIGGGGRASNHYQLVMSSGDNLSPLEEPRGDNLTPLKGPRGDSSDTPGVTAVSPEPSKNRKRESKAATPLPKDWKRSEADRAWQYERDIPDSFGASSTERFRNYWHGNGKPMKDWSMTWRNWVSRDWDRLYDSQRTQWRSRDASA